MSKSTRTISLVLALILALSLTACDSGGGKSSSSMASGGAAIGGGTSSRSPQEGTPAGESASRGDTPEPAVPEVPAREPIGSPAVIDYPELVPAELSASPVYQEALGRPSAILYNGEPVTSPQPVQDFVAAVAEGKDWDLYLYIFRSAQQGRDLSCYHFAVTDGTLTRSAAFEDHWDSFTEESAIRTQSVTLNNYGYFVYGSENGVPVVNDRALYDNAEERQQMYDTYLVPIAYSGLGMNWGSPKELGSGSLLFLFDELYSCENDDTPWDHFGGSDWPVDEIVAYLSRYFDGVTAQQVIGSKFPYDDKTNTIHYEGGRGGMSPTYRVTGWSREGDRLTIDYESYLYYTGEPTGSHQLVVRTLEDGSFRYLSNKAPQ